MWRQEEGDPEGHSRDVCRSPGKPIPQHAETGIPGPPGSSAQLTPVVATQEGAWAPTPAAMPPWAPPPLRRPQEPQPRLQDALWEQRGPRDPKSWKAAWPEPRSREEAPAGAEQEALQRLLELHRAARERRLRDREQQRLRVRPVPGPRLPGVRWPEGSPRRSPADCCLPRSWNDSASSGTTVAGFTLWGSLPAQLRWHHRLAPGEGRLDHHGSAPEARAVASGWLPRGSAGEGRPLGGSGAPALLRALVI